MFVLELAYKKFIAKLFLCSYMASYIMFLKSVSHYNVLFMSTVFSETLF